VENNKLNPYMLKASPIRAGMEETLTCSGVPRFSGGALTPNSCPPDGRCSPESMGGTSQPWGTLAPLRARRRSDAEI